MSVTPNYPMADRAGADPLGLAITEFRGLVLAELPIALKFGGSYYEYDGMGNQTDQFPVIGRIVAREHTPGTSLTGQVIPSEARTIPFDSKEIVADTWECIVDRFRTHFDYRQGWAREIANAIAVENDSRTARMIALGARQGPRAVTGGISFAGGNLVRRNAATLAAAYPLSVTGSQNIQDDLGAMRVLMQNANVDFEREDCIAYMDFTRAQVLARDKTIQSQEYRAADSNQLLTKVITKVEGFRIVTTAQMPNAAVTTGESAYQGNFTYTGILCTANRMAVGQRNAKGVDVWGPEWHSDVRSWHMGAAHFCGKKWLKPAFCGEIYVNTSDYSLTSGVYAP